MAACLPLELELDKLQCEAFNYFLHEVNHKNGLIKDKTAKDWPASIAALGFALASYPVAVERGLMARGHAVERTLNTLRFLWNSPQGTEPNATGYKGFFYHFLDMQTGERAWQSELSTVDSTFLIAGGLTAAVYFNQPNSQESEIRQLAEALFCRMDWLWALNEGKTVSMGWKPESGFLSYRWEGYDEALLLYILGLSSPTHPLPAVSFTEWAKSYCWKTIYGYDYVYAGSLFTHQYSHIWIDFRKIQDVFMREKKSDYFENSRRATYVQQQYAIQNPLDLIGYGENVWGITASDGPGFISQKINGIVRHFYNYIARGAPYGPDDGTTAPWSAITSMPFAPEIVLPLLDHCTYHLKLREGKDYGFSATFNQTFKVKEQTTGYWVSPWHYGINLGPMLLMIENYRSGLIWKLMRECPYIVNGLKSAGFTGGWL